MILIPGAWQFNWLSELSGVKRPWNLTYTATYGECSNNTNLWSDIWKQNGGGKVAVGFEEQRNCSWFYEGIFLI